MFLAGKNDEGPNIREGLKETQLFQDHVPYQGGGAIPHPQKKLTFISQNVKKNTQHALKTLFIKTICLYCHPCLSSGSNEIYIKKRETKICVYFLSPKEVEGVGGQSLGDMSPKK